MDKEGRRQATTHSAMHTCCIYRDIPYHPTLYFHGPGPREHVHNMPERAVRILRILVGRLWGLESVGNMPHRS